jgi:acetoin utilization deacetylase AcuC-like enzyme
MMITVFSESHHMHFGKFELIEGQFVTPFERPERMDIIMQRIADVQLGKIVKPREFGLDPITRVHTPEFIEFMRTAHASWKQSHGDTDAMPICWPTRTFRQKAPTAIDGLLSYYSFDAATPITAGTWQAITASVNVALTGVELIQSGHKSVFSACRPPGHHAASEIYGGYCFFNNAAVAAQALLDKGAERVALLDVDYHHGNGSQSIFYDRADVLYVSLHGDPSLFVMEGGYAVDEIGVNVVNLLAGFLDG